MGKFIKDSELRQVFFLVFYMYFIESQYIKQRKKWHMQYISSIFMVYPPYIHCIFMVVSLQKEADCTQKWYKNKLIYLRVKNRKFQRNKYNFYKILALKKTILFLRISINLNQFMNKMIYKHVQKQFCLLLNMRLLTKLK